MRYQVSAHELVIGDEYVECNPYHPEVEYGSVWYAGTTMNKYGDTCHLFSETPLPEGYDGNPDAWNISGPFFEEDDIERGCICR